MKPIYVYPTPEALRRGGYGSLDREGYARVSGIASVTPQTGGVYSIVAEATAELAGVRRAAATPRLQIERNDARPRGRQWAVITGDGYVEVDDLPTLRAAAQWVADRAVATARIAVHIAVQRGPHTPVRPECPPHDFDFSVDDSRCFRCGVRKSADTISEEAK